MKATNHDESFFSIKENVLCFQIAMNNGLVVHVVEGDNDLSEIMENYIRRERLLLILDELLEGSTLRVLHHFKRYSVDFKENQPMDTWLSFFLYES